MAKGGMKSGFRVHGLWFREKVRRRKAYEEGRKEIRRVAFQLLILIPWTLPLSPFTFSLEPYTLYPIIYTPGLISNV
jgi:hypothetical protein